MSGPAPTRPSLRRAVSVMAVGTALSRLTGLGRLVALAFALGVAESRLADSYNIANTLPNVVYELVLGGVLTSVFLPVVIAELRSRDHDDGWEAVSALVTVAMAVLVTMTVVAVVAAPWIVRLFTLRVPGAQAVEQQAVATFFLRIFAPQIAFYGMSAIAGGLLNAHERFAVPMFAPILNNLVVIATFVAFAAVVSGTPSDAALIGDTTAKLLLALGTTAGVGAMALAHWPSILRLPGRVRLRFDPRHPALRRMARLSGWTVGYVVANQVSFAVVLVLANSVQGGPTAFAIAFAFFQLPYGVAAVSITTAIFPRMTQQAVDGDRDGFRNSIAAGIGTIGLIMIPATVGFLSLSRPLVTSLLEHGVMGRSSSVLVSDVLNMFAVGLLPFSVFLFLLRAFYAREDARTPMLINMVANAAFILSGLALFRSLGVPGLALAHSVSYLVGAVLAGLTLNRRTNGLDLGRTGVSLVKVVMASGVAGGAMTVALRLVSDNAYVQLLVGGITGLFVFLGVALLLRVKELDLLRRLWPLG